MTGADKREEFEFAGTRHDLICAIWKRLIVSQVSVDQVYMDWAKPHIERLMKWLHSEILIREDWIKQMFREFDPIARNLKKAGYQRSKKAKYLKGFAEHAKGGIPRIKAFTVFPKKGEVFLRSPGSFVDADGFLHGVDERPRAICNTADVGFVQVWQSAIFPILKDIIPGFVQGLPKKEME